MLTEGFFFSLLIESSFSIFCACIAFAVVGFPFKNFSFYDNDIKKNCRLKTVMIWRSLACVYVAVHSEKKCLKKSDSCEWK